MKFKIRGLQSRILAGLDFHTGQRTARIYKMRKQTRNSTFQRFISTNVLIIVHFFQAGVKAL